MSSSGGRGERGGRFGERGREGFAGSCDGGSLVRAFGLWLRAEPGVWDARTSGGFVGDRAVPGASAELCGGRRLKGRRADGERGESAALEFIEGLGYTLVERNFQTRYGEIDLILRDGGTLVFCEVKLRRSTSFGEPVEAVTAAKQQKLRLVAEEYLVEKEPDYEEVRFDVVGILRRGKDEITHVVDAF